MSNDKWRFDPNMDYSRDDYGESDRGRKGFSPMKHSKQHHNDKFDGKRMKRNNHRRDRGR